jgi:hypothetical protein
VEGIGQYFCHPYQAGADIANEKQLHGAEQQAAEADAQPDLTNVLHDGRAIGVRRENPEQRGTPPQQCRRQRPD